MTAADWDHFVDLFESLARAFNKPVTAETPKQARDYFEHLSDYPLPLIEQAKADLIRSSKFWPKVVDWRRACDSARSAQRTPAFAMSQQLEDGTIEPVYCCATCHDSGWRPACGCRFSEMDWGGRCIRHPRSANGGRLSTGYGHLRMPGRESGVSGQPTTGERWRSRRADGARVIAFEVLGALATKGSGRAFTYRKKTGEVGVRITSDNPTLRAWETRARAEAVAARIRAGEGLIARPAGVSLTAVFRLPRPMKFSTPKYQAGRAFAPPHTVRPDVDKLLRALGDALRGAIYEDDAQIVTLSVGKRYAGLGEGWGVAVTVERLEDANDGRSGDAVA